MTATKLIDDPVSWLAEHSGVHKTIVKKYFDELEKAGIDWMNFDIETIADEVRDYAQTGGRMEHPQLRKRLGLSPVIEKTAEEQAKEQEIEGLLVDKPGVKNLLRRVYADPKLSNKQKDELKQKIIAGAPEMATLIALYNGEEQDYAKELLKEMVLSPTSDIRDLLKGDTLKVKSSRGWIKEINDIPLAKPLRSIDLVPLIADYKVIASQPGKEYTIAVYSKSGIPEVKPIPPPVKPIETVVKPAEEPSAEEFVIPESRTAMGGKPLTTREFCYRCGREAKTDQFSKQVNDHTVYFCSELCYYADKQPQRIIPKFGIGQTVSEETIAEIRSKAFVKPLVEEKPMTKKELVEGVAEAYDKRAEELTLGYGYADLKKLGDEHKLRLKGSKKEMLIELLKHNIL